MAIVEVKVPQLSESVAEATLLQWKKKPGDAVAMDEILIEIETDKVVLEVPAPAAGVLAEIVAADGATRASAEQVIARIDTEGKAGAARRRAAAAAPRCRRGRAAAAAGGGKGGVAMPAAAKLMADNKLAAGSVAGTGKDGRVTKGDVLGALARAKAARRAPAPAAGARRWPAPLPPVAAPATAEPGRPPRAARADDAACAPAWPSACCSRSPPTPS